MPVVHEAFFDVDAATGQLVRQPGITVPVSWHDLVWAAVTVGRRSQFDVFRFGFSSRMEVIWRAALLRANLELSQPARRSRRGRGFAPSSAFWALDGSEKGAVTYFMGLALAKLAAERRWDVPWVLHLDVYSRRANPYGRPINVVLPGSGRRRPDLIGQSMGGDWLVLESKGRTGHVSDDLRLDAKEQTRLISMIDGQRPRWRIASVARFHGGTLAVDLIDPLDPLPGAEPLSLPPGEFLRAYYALVLGCIPEGAEGRLSADRRSFVTGAIDEADLTIGIEKHLYQVLRDDMANPDAALPLDVRVRDVLANQRAVSDGEEDARERIGRDGVLVQLGPSWHTDNPDG